MVSKKKSSNPLDAHRKAERVKQLKKNKEKRDESREVALVRKDTRGLEKDIRFLQQKRPASEADNAELSQLTSELERIKTAKEEYLQKHPEHRKFVYPREEEEKAEQEKRDIAASEAKKARQPQRDPSRSVYYHEVYNPYGAPPPGMPYLEKTEAQWEAEQRAIFEALNGGGDGKDEDEEDSESSSEDDIVMPEGDAPASMMNDTAIISTATHSENGDDTDDSSDEDGIVMPKGPPPGPPKAPRAMLGEQPSHFLMASPPLPPPQSYARPPFQPAIAPHVHPRPPYMPPDRSYPIRPFTPPVQQFHHSSSPRPNSNPSTIIGRPQPARPNPPPAPAPIVITSAPVMRDLKKEVTAFVPSALRKKAAATNAAKRGTYPATDGAPPQDARGSDVSSDSAVV